MTQRVNEYTISDIVELIHRRRINKQDSRIVFTGNTGKAKSTCAAKILFRIDGFDPWKHQVYDRKDAIDLIMEYETICFDDEAIETLYNRGFHSTEQQDYIRKIIKNRDHYNILFTVLPRFQYLDKHVKPLYFMHIMMIHRPELDKVGKQVDPNDTAIGLIFAPKEYGEDPWRILAEEKMYKKWDEMATKNPNFKPPYHQLPTFEGILRFRDITPKQREIIDLVKKTKKYAKKEDGQDFIKMSFIDKQFKKLISGGLSEQKLKDLLEDYNYDKPKDKQKKLSSVKVSLNTKLRDDGYPNRLKHYFKLSDGKEELEQFEETNDLIGDI